MNPLVREKIFLVLAIIGLALIISNVDSKSIGNEKKADSSSSFSTEPVRVEGFSDSDGSGEVPTQIVIPKVGIDIRVRPSRIVKGYWEVFNDVAGWGEGSGHPGEVGNQVIFAHVREGLFLPLKDVSIGDRVYVTTKEDWYSYEVVEIREVLPSQVEVVAPTSDETLTLYTCSGYEDSKRLIVVGKRV